MPEFDTVEYEGCGEEFQALPGGTSLRRILRSGL